tara:strand:+ start:149 stop:445 length:297 start_codon:yes stop_codon:yes gene_type:complete
MFSFDRDTTIVVAAIVCVLITVYIYRELNKAKDEINGFRKYHDEVIEHIKEIPAIPVPVRPNFRRPPPQQQKQNPGVSNKLEDIEEEPITTQVDDDNE